jgi:hypothetical protein
MLITELPVPQARLGQPALRSAQVETLNRVAGHGHIRHAGHVFEQPPVRLGSRDAALEFR